MEERKKLYYQIITEAWQLLKSNMESCDWDKMLAVFDDWSKKYTGTCAEEYARQILFNTVEELRRIHNE